MVGSSCIPYTHGCDANGCYGINVSGHKLSKCPKLKRDCFKIPLGHPRLTARKSSAPSCLPPPVCPIVPNCCNISLCSPPYGCGGVPKFCPPQRPCAPCSPLRTPAMPLCGPPCCRKC